jgi:hypothetical protein
VPSTQQDLTTEVVRAAQRCSALLAAITAAADVSSVLDRAHALIKLNDIERQLKSPKLKRRVLAASLAPSASKNPQGTQS